MILSGGTHCPVSLEAEGARPSALCLDCSVRTLQMSLSSGDSFVLNQWVLYILVYEKMFFAF